MQTIIFIHAFFAFATLISGVFVYSAKDSILWQKPTLWLYLLPHLITAITGLSFGSLFEFSPFRVLSLLTIVTFARVVYCISKQKFDTAKAKMFPAFVGLCIAFVGTLHPERLLGYRFLVKGLGFSVDSGEKVWIAMMLIAVVVAIMVAIQSVLKKRKSL